MEGSLDQLVRFTLNGKKFSMTGRQVLDQARQALRYGVPEEALRYKSIVIQIDGQPVGAKWLMRLVTGLTSSDFDSSRADSVFKKMGLPVQRLDESGLVPRNAAREDIPARSGMLSAEPPGDPHAILERQMREIRDFLRGRAARPNDERLCDWVQFCYTFELYAEGRDLFQLVDPSQVNTWYYERTKKLASICQIRTKTGLTR